MRRLGELLDEPWDDDEPSDVHIQEAHFYGAEIPTANLRKKSEDVTQPDNEVPVKYSLSPKAKKLSLLITIIVTGIAGAVKIIWEVWNSLQK